MSFARASWSYWTRALLLVFLIIAGILYGTPIPVVAAATTINYYVHNVSGPLVANIHVLRYDSSWNPLDSQWTDSSGKAVWTSIPDGAYNFEAYNPGIVGGWRTEYWGDASVSLTGGTQNYDFYRFTPWAYWGSVHIGDTAGNPKSVFSVGDTVRTTISVKNDAGYQLQVYVNVAWDKDQNEPFDFQGSSASSYIPSKQSGSFYVDYLVPSAMQGATLHLAAWVETRLLNGNLRLTDSFIFSNYYIQIRAQVPSPPQNLQASAGIGHVDLAWSAPSSDGGSTITGYKIYRGTSSGSESLLVTLGNQLSYQDSAAINGQAYYYKVTAVNSAGESGFSNEATATPISSSTPPSPPVNLQAIPSSGKITLSWNAPASDGGSPLTGYKIYRGTSSGGEHLLSTIGLQTSYIDSAVLGGYLYYYQVTAISIIGESQFSNEASATVGTPPTPPRDVIAVSGAQQIEISWSVPFVSGGYPITGYNVYRSTSAGTETLLTSIGVLTSYIDSGLSDGTTYYYVVTALNAVGESNFSSEARVTTAPSGFQVYCSNFIIQSQTWALDASNLEISNNQFTVSFKGTTGTFNIISGMTRICITFSGYQPQEFNFTATIQTSVTLHLHGSIQGSYDNGGDPFSLGVGIPIAGIKVGPFSLGATVTPVLIANATAGGSITIDVDQGSIITIRMKYANGIWTRAGSTICTNAGSPGNFCVQSQNSYQMYGGVRGALGLQFELSVPGLAYVRATPNVYLEANESTGGLGRPTPWCGGYPEGTQAVQWRSLCFGVGVNLQGHLGLLNFNFFDGDWRFSLGSTLLDASVDIRSLQAGGLVSLKHGESQQFSAIIAGGSSHPAFWLILQSSCGTLSSSLSAMSMYTAPNGPALCSVQATVPNSLFPSSSIMTVVVDGAGATTNATVQQGTATVDLTSTGTFVTITGSTASSGTSVIVSAAKLNSQPVGTSRLSLNGVGYYDIWIGGISDGTARVCITNPSISSSTNSILYWTGRSWVSASNITVSGNKLCGNIPVGALTGTPFVIGSGALGISPYAGLVSVLLASLIILKKKPARSSKRQ